MDQLGFAIPAVVPALNTDPRTSEIEIVEPSFIADAQLDILSAVAHSLARTVGSVDGKPFNDHVMVMHFWVKQGANWRLVAHQTTKVP